jgi:beta-galactosidase
MKRGNFLALITSLIFVRTALIQAANADPDSHARTIIPFDSDWRFLKSDCPGAGQQEFNDASWRTVALPHDWSIEGSFDQTNSTRGAGGFLPAGVGWYRKHFRLPAEVLHRRVFVEFDGVMANSEIWINGFSLGNRPYGYMSFCYELTGHLNPRASSPWSSFVPDSVIAVRADNSAQPASRWYSGAGVFRHVRLVVTDAVHIAPWGTFVSTPNVTSNSATVRVQCSVTNESEFEKSVRLLITLLDPRGRISQRIFADSQSISPGQSGVFQEDFALKRPRLWDLDHPNLYHVAVQALIGVEIASVVDETVTPFGIRDAHFDADTGFWLNGRNLKIKGVCLHHDGGAFGAAVPLGVWEHRLESLRRLGVNAIRTAHNPPASEFLDLCDRMGFLVMDELFDCWTVGKNPHDYHVYFNDWSAIDARDTVLRDRNHPSIIMYSAGNEIHDTPHAELAKRILGGLVEVFHQNDPTRPVTQALFRPNVSHDYDDGLADMLDVIGQNYRENEILAAHAQKPTRKILGTENGHDRAVWLALRDNPPYAGQFLWSGIDYLGESRAWPAIGAGSGLLDRTGAPHPRAFERQSWWSDRPMVRIARRLGAQQATPADPGFQPLNRRQLEACDWTPGDLQPHEETVEIFSNCEQVELLLNGKSLGSKPLPEDASPRAWKLQFEPGALEAIGRNAGKIVARDKLRTAGKPARITLTAERDRVTPDFDDVVCVTASVADKDGVPVPNADDLITFNSTGPGRIAAVDNGDNASHEPFQASERHAFRGQCVAFVRAAASKGHITVNASAPGLEGGSVKLTADER